MYWIKKNSFIILGVVLLAGGLLMLMGKWQESRYHQGLTESEIDSNWENVESQEGLFKKTKKQKKDPKDLGIVRDTTNRTSISDEMIGVISSSVIGLKEPIYMGASELNMRRGVATVDADELLNEHTVAISGHRSNIRYKYFSEVLRLKKGNEIVIETKNENGDIEKTVYVVEKSYKVDPYQTDVLGEDKNKPRKLILITCDEWNAKTKTYDKRWITEAYLKE